MPSSFFTIPLRRELRWTAALVASIVASTTTRTAHADEVSPSAPVPANAPPNAPPSPTVGPTPSVAGALVPPAQGQSPEDVADLARLRALVARGGEPGRSYRLVGGLTGLGIGAVATPVGAVMISRDSGSVGAGIVLGAGIGSAVGGVLVLTGLFEDNPYSAVDSAISREKGAGRTDHDALVAGEAEFKKSVDSMRRGRVIGGGLVMGLGLASLGAGAVFGLGDFTGPKLDRRQQDAISAGFIGYGVLSTLVGLQAMLFPTPVESAWDGYAAGKRTTASVGPRLLGAGGTPLPEGGATVGFYGSF